MRLQQGQTIDHRLPFTRVDAKIVDIDQARLLGREFQRVFHGVYVGSSRRPDLALRAQAALAIGGPTAWVSHSTCAELLGAVVPDGGLVHISLPAGHYRCQRRGVRAHLAPRGESGTRKTRGLRTSSPTQCLLEMAQSGVNLVDLVVAADSMIRAKTLTLEALSRAAPTWTGRGSRVARRAAGLAREGVDSAMETRVRMLIVLAGLPEPTVNLILRAEDGSWSWRLDLSYPELKMVVEYDGRQHLENSTQWRKDRSRRETFDQLRWRVLTADSEDVYGDPGAFLDRVASVLRELGAENVRRSYKPEWRQYFPGRAR